jgi:hypothetical protein
MGGFGVKAAAFTPAALDAACRKLSLQRDLGTIGL